nr:reverse transcriptase domain-containing protein [Tanacetum cinerariifolium]
MLPVTQIDTFYNGLTLRHRDTINAATGGTFMKRRPEECYDLIKNMTAHHNGWDTSAQWSESSSSITSSSDPKIVALKAEIAEININLMKVLQINQQVKAVTHNCETCAGPHSYNDCPATVVQTRNTDMVIHTEKTKMIRLVVEIKYVGKICNVFDKVTRSFDGYQPEQVDLNYVHALNEPHLHEICVVPSRHEADQHLSCANPLPI